MKKLEAYLARSLGIMEGATKRPWKHGYSDGSGKLDTSKDIDYDKFCLVSAIDDDGIVHGRLFSHSEADPDAIVEAVNEHARLCEIVRIQADMLDLVYLHAPHGFLCKGSDDEECDCLRREVVETQSHVEALL